MKAILPAIFCFCSISFSYAQNVGVGTQTPVEKLQVDSGNVKIGQAIWSTNTNDHFLKFGDGDFVSIGEADGDDFMKLNARRFTFTSSGGMDTPFVTFQGNIMIADGTEGAGKVLTSSSTGKATWQDPGN